jgi:sugar phosphate isomerase/epimerase
MVTPHVHVPFQKVGDYLPFIKQHKINLELYFSSDSLDRLEEPALISLHETLDYNPLYTIHAPFMDLSPGAVDSRVRAATIERFSHILDIAHFLRPKAIVFHSGYEKWKYALRFDVWLEKSLMTWKPLIQRAADSGLKIAIENIFEDDPTNLRLLMEAAGSEHFGLCFDTGHFNLFSAIPLDQWLAEIQGYIVELHLHDNKKTSDEHSAIGDGDFDFKTLFSGLRGRDIIFTIEGHTPEDVLKSLERLQGYL